MLLYIHIPFCDSKCSYCAFNSYVDKFHLKQEYMDALLIQLKHEITRFKVEEKSIETVFIGGGTPSTITPKLYAPLFHYLHKYLQDDIEITSEANPNSASFEWLAGMKKLGVNRISFGVQSFHAEKLKLLNRAHSPQQAKDAIINAAKVGYKNLSLDIIYATLGDTQELLQHDLESAFALPINHLSAYALTIEEGTAFESKPQMAKERLPLTEWLFQSIRAKGFTQYEISNFGTYQSKHNLGYWEYKDYIGVGCGAVGKLAHERLYPSKNVEHYIANPTQIEKEQLTQEDIKTEQIFLGLRSCVGISLHILNKAEKDRVQILLDEKKLTLVDETLYNPDYLLADEIALFISS